MLEPMQGNYYRRTSVTDWLRRPTRSSRYFNLQRYPGFRSSVSDEPAARIYLSLLGNRVNFRRINPTHRGLIIATEFRPDQCRFNFL